MWRTSASDDEMRPRQGTGGLRLLSLSRVTASPRLIICFFSLACLVLTAAGCRQQMGQQPKYQPLEPSTFFADGRSAREPVRGTVARSFRGDDAPPPVYKTAGTYTDNFPSPVTPQLLARGRERFEINCAACHGLTGDGDGMIVRRGFSPPPSFNADDVRAQPVGFYFDIITHGYGAMASYAAQVNAQDRWAIVAYIRALQLSQHATIDDVPPEERPRLTSGGETR